MSLKLYLQEIMIMDTGYFSLTASFSAKGCCGGTELSACYQQDEEKNNNTVLLDLLWMCDENGFEQELLSFCPS